MARYTYKSCYHWKENPDILEQEVSQLAAWLASTKIDPDFEMDNHVYHHADTGDVWLFLPELTQRQLMAATLILSSSELSFDNKPIRFSHPPNAKVEDYDDN